MHLLLGLLSLWEEKKGGFPKSHRHSFDVTLRNRLKNVVDHSSLPCIVSWQPQRYRPWSIATATVQMFHVKSRASEEWFCYAAPAFDSASVDTRSMTADLADCA
ncbi:unnamed protein product [Polarella glacialis]|uniref:Uncharacterized protein n=1 Tax=Polarella glacialis TaxID=89957 RepID=A0A813FHD9_POLGL|nr:unnamed protein product [Polarella glacialis]